jgi:hypothetical protein
MTAGKRAHDVGGDTGAAIDRSEHPREDWEKEVEALWRLLARHEGVQADELRRGIEDLGAGEYDRLGYFERWIASLTEISIERGIVSIEDLAARLETLQAGSTGSDR